MTAALWTPEPSNDKVRQVPPRPTRGRGVGESRALTVPPSPCRDGATQLMPGPWTRTSSSPPSSDSRICCILEPLHYLTQESALEGGRALLPLPEPRPLPAARSPLMSCLCPCPQVEPKEQTSHTTGPTAPAGFPTPRPATPPRRPPPAAPWRHHQPPSLPFLLFFLCLFSSLLSSPLLRRLGASRTLCPRPS